MVLFDVNIATVDHSICSSGFSTTWRRYVGLHDSQHCVWGSDKFYCQTWLQV